ERFRQAEEQYFRLKGQVETGRITREQFDAAHKQLMVQDAQGRYWMLGPDSGKWYVHDGQTWVESTPPIQDRYAPPPPEFIAPPRRANNAWVAILLGLAVACLALAAIFGIIVSTGALQIASSATSTPMAIILPTAMAPPASSSTPTWTVAPTNTSTPSPTFTPTTFLTPTPKPLPAGRANLPSTITIKYDDGVSPEMRDEIEKGAAMAYETLGEAGPVTVIAYANLDAMIAEQARLIGRAIDSPTITLNKKNFASGNTLAQANANTISIYTAGGWKNASSAFHIQSLAHEYYHVLQSLRSQATFSADLGPKWLVEGTARYVENHTAAAYGLGKVEDAYRDALVAGSAFRNPLQSLETENGATMEDYSARYPLGYLAVEFLVSRYGEDGILYKFWQAEATAPTWQDAFTQTIGVSPDEFYRQFEAFRLAQFPPLCGDIRNTVEKLYDDPLSIRLARQSAPGAMSLSYASYSLPPNLAYAFCFDGVNLAQVLPLAPKLKLPAGYRGWQSLYPNVIVVYMPPSAVPGTYTFGIDLGDKGRAETKFEHTVIST
ncbi:MAG: collagenase, partial [Chloroflexota bacterium]|nr:collagenase [Chloroflexota bacterium]